jgi:hypothetical protein
MLAASVLRYHAADMRERLAERSRPFTRRSEHEMYLDGYIHAPTALFQQHFNYNFNSVASVRERTIPTE